MEEGNFVVPLRCTPAFGRVEPTHPPKAADEWGTRFVGHPAPLLWGHGDWGVSLACSVASTRGLCRVRGMRLTAFTGGKKRGSGFGGAKVDQRTTVPGYVNGNRQEVMARTGFGSASFPGQTIYKMRCGVCLVW